MSVRLNIQLGWEGSMPRLQPGWSFHLQQTEKESISYKHDDVNAILDRSGVSPSSPRAPTRMEQIPSTRISTVLILQFSKRKNITTPLINQLNKTCTLKIMKRLKGNFSDNGEFDI